MTENSNKHTKELFWDIIEQWMLHHRHLIITMIMLASISGQESSLHLFGRGLATDDGHNP